MCIHDEMEKACEMPTPDSLARILGKTNWHMREACWRQWAHQALAVMDRQAKQIKDKDEELAKLREFKTRHAESCM